RLHQGELFQGQSAGRVQLAGGDEELGAQAAVGVYTQDLQVLAAVAAAAPAGEAALAVQVRLHRTAVARLDVRHAGADVQDLDAKLVAGDARVAVKGHLAEIAADVGAADADAVDAHQGIARFGPVGLRDADLPKRAWLFEEDGLHALVSPCPGWLSMMISHPPQKTTERRRAVLAGCSECALFFAFFVCVT